MGCGCCKFWEEEEVSPPPRGQPLPGAQQGPAGTCPPYGSSPPPPLPTREIPDPGRHAARPPPQAPRPRSAPERPTQLPRPAAPRAAERPAPERAASPEGRRTPKRAYNPTPTAEQEPSCDDHRPCKAQGAEEEDLYAVLGVPRDCSQSELRRQYKQLAVRWHPDKNPQNREQAERMFKAIGEAYQVLSDPTKRQLYDKYGMEGVRCGGPPCNGGWGSPRGFAFMDPFDIFRDFFGGEDPFAQFGLAHPFAGVGFSSGRATGASRLFSGFADADDGFGGGFFGGMGGGVSMQTMVSGGPGTVQRCVSSQTVFKDGRKVTRTVTRTTDADGTVHEDVEETIGDAPTRHIAGSDLPPERHLLRAT
eukprot:TRINITY_DN19605_c0_g1_i1.p1 TRINITY_DN19605_c0_g1~~TRINITY_DN19605_c0_g1_i1.p1  ORF type:complete len:363 (+),score=106.08 TRINITY_DN19605_c0_g1_i1:74-1162(+)